jgi:ring-1,2-phenylacetyl-CoA epoxidase subunit PaaC
MQKQTYHYLLLLGDNVLILGHRLSELCGHGPNLETDIALTNISLDLFGQVRNYFQYAAELRGEGKTEDDIAMLRQEQEYRNTLLVEQPNTDFAYIITRQFLFDAYHLPLLEQLMKSKDEQIAAIAAKSIKEVRYHLRFSSEWMKRLGDGTAESHRRTQVAVDNLYRYTRELFQPTAVEQELQKVGIAADLNQIKPIYQQTLRTILTEATLTIPNDNWNYAKGKQGIHTEQMGFILSELQYMQRAYPDMSW